MKSTAKKKPVSKKAAKPVRATKTPARFVLIGKSGKPLGRSKSAPVAVLDTEQSLMLDLATSEPLPHAEAMAAAAAVRTAGFKDWRAPTSKELFGFVDHSKFKPAADPILQFLPDWHWTASPVASVPGYAWIVLFGYGSVGIHYRGGRCRVRAVRSAVPASQ